MHAQSLAWFFGFVFAAATLYRRIMGPTIVAGLAALLFALDDAHATPAGWLAGRNTLLAAFLGIVALLAHDRWRRDGWRIGAIAGPAAFLASLLSGEMGVATLAYVVPYALWIDPAPWKRRLAATAPYLLVVIVWRVTWAALGYGVYGVAAYVDPLTQPLRFARVVLETGPIMLMGQWALPPSDFYILYDTFAAGLSRVVWTVAAGFVVLAAAIMLPWLRRDRIARVWACGMGLSLLPVCASTNFPMDRLLLFVGLGAMGLLAQFLAFVGEHRRQLVAGTAGLPRKIPAQILAVLFVVIHLILAPASFIVRAATPAGPRSFTQQFYVNTPFDAQIEQQDLVVINAPSAGIVGMMPVLRALDGQPIPLHTRMLGPSLASIEISRPDARTLVLRPDGGWMAWAYDQLVRGSDYPLALHELIELTGTSVEVSALTPDGRPAEAVFRFDRPLEDQSLRWLQWKDRQFIPFAPPAVGNTVRLPPTTPVLR
jgi:hypothetical protein